MARIKHTSGARGDKAGITTTGKAGPQIKKTRAPKKEEPQVNAWQFGLHAQQHRDHLLKECDAELATHVARVKEAGELANKYLLLHPHGDETEPMTLYRQRLQDYLAFITKQETVASLRVAVDKALASVQGFRVPAHALQTILDPCDPLRMVDELRRCTIIRSDSSDASAPLLLMPVDMISRASLRMSTGVVTLMRTLKALP